MGGKDTGFIRSIADTKQEFEQIRHFLHNHENEAIELWKSLLLCNTKVVKACAESKGEIRGALLECQNFLNGSGEQPNYKFDNHFDDGYSVLEIPDYKPESPRRNYLGRKSLIFLVHIDTVYSPADWRDHKETGHQILGSITEHEKYGKILHGPGALDMKGGLAESLLILKTLLNRKLNNRPIRLIVTYQEERGHMSYPELSKSEDFRKLFEDAEAAFSFDTSSMRNEVIIGRYGVRHTKMTVIGKSAHIGRDPEKGHSAIDGAAQVINTIYEKTHGDVNLEYHITPTRIIGGNADNSVSAKCEVILDCRFRDDRAEHFLLQFIDYLKGRGRDGATIYFEHISRMPAMEVLTGSMKLRNEFAEICNEYETKLQPVHFVVSGGGGDAAFATRLGIPTLDGLGVMGENNHTFSEWAQVSSLKDKAEMVLALLLDKFLSVRDTVK